MNKKDLNMHRSEGKNGIQFALFRKFCRSINFRQTDRFCCQGVKVEFEHNLTPVQQKREHFGEKKFADASIANTEEICEIQKILLKFFQG